MLHFDYIEPATLEEAASALSQEAAGRIIAGGTDILVQIKEEKIAVDRLVSLARIPGLGSIGRDKGWINIGAMTTMSEIETSDLVRQSAPILFDAVERLGSVQIRNVATLGGNICNAAPSADTIPALLALKAEAIYWTPDGMKREKLEKFFPGPGRTILERWNILTSISFEEPHLRSSGAYLKFSRRKGMDLPLLGMAVQLQMDKALSCCEDVTIALGLAGPTPVRATGAEEILKGERMTEEVLAAAADRASQDAKPRDSFRCSADYRKAMIRNLLPGVVKSALSRVEKRMEKGI